MNRPNGDTNHSPISSKEVKNSWKCSTSATLTRFHDVISKSMGNFNFDSENNSRTLH